MSPFSITYDLQSLNLKSLTYRDRTRSTLVSTDVRSKNCWDATFLRHKPFVSLLCFVRILSRNFIGEVFSWNPWDSLLMNCTSRYKFCVHYCLFYCITPPAGHILNYLYCSFQVISLTFLTIGESPDPQARPPVLSPSWVAQGGVGEAFLIPEFLSHTPLQALVGGDPPIAPEKGIPTASAEESIRHSRLLGFYLAQPHAADSAFLSRHRRDHPTSFSSSVALSLCEGVDVAPDPFLTPSLLRRNNVGWGATPILLVFCGKGFDWVVCVVWRGEPTRVT